MHKDHDLHRRRRSRNFGVLILALGFVALMFAVTVVKLGANAGNPWG